MIKDLLSRLLRAIHCLIRWHEPVDGDEYFWCGTCGKCWRREDMPATDDFWPDDPLANRGEFKVIEDRGRENDLECPGCAFQFTVNAVTQENLEWDGDQRAYVAMCPICGKREK